MENIKNEKQAYEDLNDRKIALEKNYTNLFKAEIDVRIEALEKLMDVALRAADITNIWSSSSLERTPNIDNSVKNVTETYNINNPTDAESVIREKANQLNW